MKLFSHKQLLALTLALGTTVCSAQQLDLLILHGTLVDGTGAPARHADIGILGDRIVFIGNASKLHATKKQTALRTIDATGLVVTPGFIDPHTHTAADLTNPKTSRNDAYLMQGVTTVATGNDGASPKDIAATLAQWAHQGIGTNAALFIGQGTVRSEVMQMSDAAPTPAQLGQMKSLVEIAMNDGAIGISTGLYYAPGSFSSTEEVIALSKVAAAHHGIYDTHMRDESSYNIGLIASVQETIRIGREAHIPLMISHIKALGADVWAQTPEVIRIINQARASGLDIVASQYPYTASGSNVTAALIPRWAEADGKLVQNLTDPALHDKLVAEIADNLRRRGGPDSILITTSGSKDKSLIGQTLTQVAADRHVTPIEAAIQISKSGNASIASFNMQESDIAAFMRQPWVITCSDGSEGHPRKFGTFPRKIHKYVYQDHILTLEAAVHSSTQLTAQTLRLKDRGVLQPGYFADVLVFDPRTFNERATYQDPAVLATGVRYLTVNGKLAIDDSALTTTLAGRPLTH